METIDLRNMQTFINVDTEYGKMLVNTRDNAVSKFLIERKAWEPFMDQHMEKHAKPGDIVLDIGANIGAHTLRLSKLVGPEGHVHAFEPNIYSAIALLFNCLQNNCHNVTIHYRGVSSEACKMYVSKDYIQPASRDFNYGDTRLSADQKSAHDASVPVVRIDDLGLGKVSFVKIDVQDMEFGVLEGMKETLARDKPVMLVECVNHQFPQIMKEKYGYTAQGISCVDDYLCLPITE